MITSSWSSRPSPWRSSIGTVYWEGLSDLFDAQQRRVGSGYLEMTGYAGRLRLGG